MTATTTSLQFDGDGDLATDTDGNPTYGREPTGDLFLALGVLRGSFHADPDLGGALPGFVTGNPRTSAEIDDAVRDSLSRLEAVGVLTVDDVLVFKTEAAVYTSATDQPFKVKL